MHSGGRKDRPTRLGAGCDVRGAAGGNAVGGAVNVVPKRWCLCPEAARTVADMIEDRDGEPTDHFHVSSTLNRASIRRHGLDASRMGAAPGIAGSSRPEADGVFVARGRHEAQWFVRMNNTGGPVDVWQVEDVDVAALEDNGNGYQYVPGTVPAARIRLVARDLPVATPDRADEGWAVAPSWGTSSA